MARNRDVGVDVERMRDDVDIDGLARRYFTDDQRPELGAPAATRTAAFFATGRATRRA